MAIRLSGRSLPKGRDAASLRKWGIIFLTIGTAGRCLLLNNLLGLGTISGEELLAAMETDPSLMAITTIGIVCLFLETCAAPLFSFLLVEGFQRTSSFEKYLLRIAGSALVTELPYNLAVSGKLIDLESRNPVFGLLICLVMLYFFRRYEGKNARSIAMKALIAVAAFLWCVMLNIDHGICLVVIVAVLWLVRGSSNVRAIFGFCAGLVCTMFNMYYMGSCLTFIMLHRYNEEEGEQNKVFNYAFYPVMLLIVGIIGKFIG